MRQSFFGVPCRHIRMSLFAVINGRVEVRDALLCMRIVLCLLGRLGSDQPPGAAFWYENSNGLAEIAVNQGRADRDLGLAIGLPVEIVS